MSGTLELTAAKRTETGKKLTALRRAGFVPGVVYGHNVDNALIKVRSSEFEQVFKEAGENTLVSLNVTGEKPYTVLIYDVATDPVRMAPIHIDFFAVNLKEKVRTEVPLTIIGESSAVKELEGTLIQPMHVLEVESLPQDIPHEITVDISSIKTFEDHITVGDLPIPTNVTVLAEPTDIVALVEEPRSQEELEELEEAPTEDVSAVEGVEKEGDEGEEESVESSGSEAESGAPGEDKDPTSE
jgi:large subunit ribosomal protein L25